MRAQGWGLRSLRFAHLSLLFFLKDPESARPGCLMGLRPAPRDLRVHSARTRLRQTGTGLQSELRVRGTRLKAGRGGQKGFPRRQGSSVSQGRDEEQKNREKNQGRVALLEENEATTHSWVRSPLEVYCCVCNVGHGMYHFAVNA